MDGYNEGTLGYSLLSVACSNPDCRKLTLRFHVGEVVYNNGYRLANANVFDKFIYPSASYKNFPDYIPTAILEDYREACLIRDLSPKASATLSRRCIQGMIRDFAGIAKARLIDEIKALKEALDADRQPRAVTPESIEAIDHVRQIGNIGAHMEKDIDHIIGVDEGEAQALIELIEMLMTEWYVARKAREDRLARIAAIGAEKERAKQTGLASSSDEVEEQAV
jgi:hypothetical protein